MAKLIIFHSWLSAIGGCETVVYNLCYTLRNYYDILMLYTDGCQSQIERLEEIVETEKYDEKKQYKCDVMINNSSWGIKPNNITATKNIYIQMIHTDYEVIRNSFTYKKWDKTTHHIACGEFVAKQFTKATGYECQPIKNILIPIKPQKIYNFVYAGRLTGEKGYNRMVKFMEMLRNNDIKFTMTVFTDGKFTHQPEEVKIMSPRLNITDYLANADYGILLSDYEGLPMFVQECLQSGTPCIVTDNGGTRELIKHGNNGYIVPKDMNFDINIIKNIPVVKNWTNGVSAKNWTDLLGYSKYRKAVKRVKKKVIQPQIKVKFKKNYINVNGERFNVDDVCLFEKTTADKLVSMKICEVVSNDD